MKCIMCENEHVLVLRKDIPFIGWQYTIFYCTECNTRWEVLTKDE